MRLTRMIIESEGSTLNYPTLYMFCHLVQHSTMDRNLEGLKLLERINDAIINHLASYDIVKAINFAFKLAEMRHELISFFASKQIGMDILNYRSGWRLFLECLFKDIAGRLVKFPDNIEGPGSGKKEKAMFRGMVDKMTASGLSVTMIPWSFCIIFDNDTNIRSISNGLRWSVKMAIVPLSSLGGTFPDGPTFRGGVGIMEDPTAFSKGR